MSDTCCTLLNIVKQVSSFNLWDHFLTDILNLRGLRAKRPQLHAYSTVNIFLLNVSAYFLFLQNRSSTIVQKGHLSKIPGHFSNGHLPLGHFPEQTHSRWTLPRPDTSPMDNSPTRQMPDRYIPDQGHPWRTLSWPEKSTTDMPDSSCFSVTNVWIFWIFFYRNISVNSGRSSVPNIVYYQC